MIICTIIDIVMKRFTKVDEPLTDYTAFRNEIRLCILGLNDVRILHAKTSNLDLTNAFFLWIFKYVSLYHPAQNTLRRF